MVDEIAVSTPRYDTFDESGRPSDQVVRAVSAAVGADRDELRPLSSAIDPRELDELIETGREEAVEFEYEGFHVTVTPDREVLLRDPESIHTRLGDETNLLVVAHGDEHSELCSELTRPYPLERENVLGVAIGESIAEVHAEWHERDLYAANRRKIVSTGEFARAATDERVTLPGSIEASLVPDANDLATLMDRIRSTLDAWEDTPAESVLCFRSIDELVEAVGFDRTYRLLYAMTHTLGSSLTLAHYHVDPIACEAEQLTTLTPIFDAVVYEDGCSTTTIVE